MGQDFVGAQATNEILVIGASAVGSEITRHLALNLVHKIVLFDTRLACEQDLKENYFVAAKHVGLVSVVDAVIESCKPLCQREG